MIKIPSTLQLSVIKRMPAFRDEKDLEAFAESYRASRFGNGRGFYTPIQPHLKYAQKLVQKKIEPNDFLKKIGLKPTNDKAHPNNAFVRASRYAMMILQEFSK